MDTAASAMRLMAAGRFRDALGYLDSEGNIKAPNRVGLMRVDLLYAELLERAVDGDSLWTDSLGSGDDGENSLSQLFGHSSWLTVWNVKPRD